MRMHPRRHGAYNFSARAASAFTNAYFKSKKKRVPNGSGCLVQVLFIAIVFVFILHMIF